MEELTQLGGVGRKTANVVLGNAFGMNCGVVVDTHVARLSQRLGLTKETAPEKIEQELMKLVPQEQWTMFSHWLIWHGRRRCYARNPDCPSCEIKALCPRSACPSKARLDTSQSEIRKPKAEGKPKSEAGSLLSPASARYNRPVIGSLRLRLRPWIPSLP